MNVTISELEIAVGLVITILSILIPVINRLEAILKSHISLHAKLDAVVKTVDDHKADIEDVAKDISKLVNVIGLNEKLK